MKVLLVLQNPKKNGYSVLQDAKCRARFVEWTIYLGIPNASGIVNASQSAGVSKFSENDELELRLQHFKYEPDKIIAFGNFASSCLNKMDIEHFKMPHPSGRNRQLNNRKWVNRKLKECKEWLEKK